jgi:hypothetical protein
MKRADNDRGEAELAMFAVDLALDALADFHRWHFSDLLRFPN